MYYLYNDYKKGQIVYPANRILQDRRNKSEHILLLRRTDFHKCWARVNGISGKEYWQVRQQNEEQIISFRIRYCRKLSELNSFDYRILYRGDTYNIQYIDNLLQADSLLIIKAKKEARS